MPTATNPVAYDLYLKGKLQLDTISQTDSPRAFDRLEGLAARAIEIDPEFARAYTLRARTLLWRLWVFCDLTDDQWRMIGNDIESARRPDGRHGRASWQLRSSPSTTAKWTIRVRLRPSVRRWIGIRTI